MTVIIEWIGWGIVGTGLVLTVLGGLVTLPRFNWYCKLRTTIYHLFPTTGDLVGIRTGWEGGTTNPPSYLVGTVTQVNRKQGEVLLLVQYNQEDRQMLYSEWVRAKDVRWFPWWVKQGVVESVKESR